MLKSDRFFFEDLQHTSMQNGDIFEAMEAPALAVDNGLYLLITRVVKLWSTRSRPVCTEKYFFSIYCNPLQHPSSEITYVTLD